MGKLGTRMCLAGMIVSAMIGGRYGCRNAGDHEYRIIRSSSQVSVHSTTTDTVHMLSLIKGELYLGDNDHNLQGIRALSLEEDIEHEQGEPNKTNASQHSTYRGIAESVYNTILNMKDSAMGLYKSFNR